MSDDLPQVDDEINDHKTELSEWVDGVSTLKVRESYKGVTERFVRDCKTLITDLDASEAPSADDLCDFVERKNSLEIQFNNIKEELE